jgi:hypothetical protein
VSCGPTHRLRRRRARGGELGAGAGEASSGLAARRPTEVGKRRAQPARGADELLPGALAGGGGGAAREGCGASHASRGGRGRSLAGSGAGAAQGRWLSAILGVIRGGWVGD